MIYRGTYSKSLSD